MFAAHAQNDNKHITASSVSLQIYKHITFSTDLYSLALTLTDINGLQIFSFLLCLKLPCFFAAQHNNNKHITISPVFPLALTDTNGFQTLCFYHVCLQLMLRITTNTLQPLVPLYPLLVQTISLKTSHFCFKKTSCAEAASPERRVTLHTRRDAEDETGRNCTPRVINIKTGRNCTPRVVNVKTGRNYTRG